MGNPSQSYRALPAIWDHTVLLPATRHGWTRSAITLAREVGAQFNYLWGMKGWVDINAGYIPGWFYLCADSHPHPSTDHLIEPDGESNHWPCDRKTTVLTLTLGYTKSRWITMITMLLLMIMRMTMMMW